MSDLTTRSILEILLIGLSQLEETTRGREQVRCHRWCYPHPRFRETWDASAERFTRGGGFTISKPNSTYWRRGIDRLFIVDTSRRDLLTTLTASISQALQVAILLREEAAPGSIRFFAERKCGRDYLNSNFKRNQEVESYPTKTDNLHQV